MDASQIKGDPQLVLQRLLEPYFAQGETSVVVASCCGRLFAGTEVPAKCRVCEKTPEVVRFASLAEVALEKIPTNTIIP